MDKNQIHAAVIGWDLQGTPVSRKYDDIYFSSEGGIAESRYVFLEGNGLPDRFIHHTEKRFVVAETGFGTGLNFLTLCFAFQTYRQTYPKNTLQHLHFISFEKFPLTRDDIQKIHQCWPEYRELSRQLVKQWPLLIKGCHRIHLDNLSITLDLWFGDVNEWFPSLPSSLEKSVDAWFLDGFAPAKNPDMWSQNLFNAIALLTKPEGTLATFTAAGNVRRGLSQSGFDITKRKGHGQKREMLIGKRNQMQQQALRAEPWYDFHPADNPDDIALIGGGVASAFTALALMRRGCKVTLYCRDELPAQNASGNHQGALYPLLDHTDLNGSEFFSTAFIYARHQYDALMEQGIHFDHDWCGILQLTCNNKHQRKINTLLQQGWPEELFYAGSIAQLTEESGLPVEHPGIVFPLGGWLSPLQLTCNVLEYAQSLGLQINFSHHLEHLSRQENTWQLHFSNGVQQSYSTVVLANGHEMENLSQTASIPIYSFRGQVSHIPTTPELTKLKRVLCYDGYLTPVNPANQYHCLGASYSRNDTNTDYRENEQQENYQRLLNCLPNKQWVKEVDISDKQARCGVRCSIRDHFPILGAVPDYQATVTEYRNMAQRLKRKESLPTAPVYPNLFMINGLGSRGLCTAPLMAEVLAAQIYGEPLPLSREMLAILNPNRMWIRKLLKDRPLTRGGQH